MYCGILFNAPSLENGQTIACTYDFTHKKYDELKSRYPIEQIAGNGGDFERALNLCRWLAPNLAHKGDFSLTCDFEDNALFLLDYSFGISQCGINCACKAKILVECCLALGIFARRVSLYPNSPYDSDNHVVAEIYDRIRQKWIMLDPTTGGYFSDGLQPLNCLEMRENYAQFAGGSIILPKQRIQDIKKLLNKNLELNSYYAKNCFYLVVETDSGFGTSRTDCAYLIPKKFDYKTHYEKNADYILNFARINNWDKSAIDYLEKRLQSAKTFCPFIGSVSLWNAPTK